MTGRVTRQSRQRLLKYSFSRSDGRGQGQGHPASFASEPLTAGRRGGYPLLTSLLIQPATRVRFDGGNSSVVPDAASDPQLRKIWSCRSVRLDAELEKGRRDRKPRLPFVGKTFS